MSEDPERVVIASTTPDCQLRRDFAGTSITCGDWTARVMAGNASSVLVIHATEGRYWSVEIGSLELGELCSVLGGALHELAGDIPGGRS